MFQINDDKGNVLRGPRRAEIAAGRAESIFNIGDKIVEGGKNYVVAGRSMSHAKEDLPTGEVQTFLYKITLKEDVPNVVEKPSEEQPSTEAEKPSEDAPTTNVEQPSEEAPKPSEDVKQSNDVKPSVKAPKEDKKAPSSGVKQEKVAPKQEAKPLPNTGVESLIGSLGAGLVALLGGLGLAIKKDRDK